MGRDPDSKWAHRLALRRRNNPDPTVDTPSSSPSPSPRSRPSSNIGDSKPFHSRSSATSYFALLSANEDGSINGRSSTNHKQHSSVSSLSRRDMYSSWAACSTERWRQRQLANMPNQMMHEKSHGSKHSFLNGNMTLLPSDTRQLPMKKHSLSPDPENAAMSRTTTTRSAIPSSAGTISTASSPSNDFLDFDINSLDTLTGLLPDFGSTLPFDPTNAQAHGTAGPWPLAGPDDGDFTWLEEQLAFPLNLGDESGCSSPSNKRSREEYPGEYIDDGQISLEEFVNKKQKMYHPWINEY